MTFRVLHWDTLDGSQYCILVCKGKIFFDILMESVMCLQFGMQKEDILHVGRHVEQVA